MMRTGNTITDLQMNVWTQGFLPQYEPLGLVYRWDWLEQRGIVPVDSIHRIQVGDAEWMQLTYGLWQSLSADIQEKWLLCWLDEQLGFQPQVVSPEIAREMTALSGSLINRYNGRFPDTSGANCFAATLAMASGTPERADSIVGLWLHEGPFKRHLSFLG
ncbi:hypothetical protein SAMN05880570_1440 [Paenibacillus sp. RU4T]|nr:MULTISPECIES: hypothetical protein [unclassified Paenibacillus]SIQ34615.1 hypothetical protein SAMN05880555_1442 [Paenibacillus sp. RU4X]SIQ56427.1 hypothetical protein SAMN05880570_1440 [Paenibacillus sp. RU4T]